MVLKNKSYMWWKQFSHNSDLNVTPILLSSINLTNFPFLTSNVILLLKGDEFTLAK